MDEFIQQLQERLKKPLPGPRAHARMVPSGQLDARLRITPRPDARPGSVLLLIYPKKGRLYFPLMLRPEYDGHHGGQVSLPGGKVEPSDPDRNYTALREAEEELGIARNDVQLIGTLSELYIPPSNFLVLPVVGVLPYRPHFVLDPVEVAAVIETPLEALFAVENQLETDRPPGVKRPFRVPYFALEEHIVWGATAMILSEFASISEPYFQPD